MNIEVKGKKPNQTIHYTFKEVKTGRAYLIDDGSILYVLHKAFDDLTARFRLTYIYFRSCKQNDSTIIQLSGESEELFCKGSEFQSFDLSVELK